MQNKVDEKMEVHTVGGRGGSPRTPIDAFNSPIVTCLARSMAWTTCCWCWRHNTGHKRQSVNQTLAQITMHYCKSVCGKWEEKGWVHTDILTSVTKCIANALLSLVCVWVEVYVFPPATDHKLQIHGLPGYALQIQVFCNSSRNHKLPFQVYIFAYVLRV